jgi:drug/metabolite transporter (DMT)-like permease
MSRDNPRLGIFLMIATTFVFAMQDGISRYLAGEYNVLMVVMIRYWFFAAFVIALASRSRGGIARAARTEQPWLQAARGVLLALEICVMVLAFTLLGWWKATRSSPATRCSSRRSRARSSASGWVGGAGRPSAWASSACW